MFTRCRNVLVDIGQAEIEERLRIGNCDVRLTSTLHTGHEPLDEARVELHACNIAAQHFTFSFVYVGDAPHPCRRAQKLHRLSR